MVQQCGGLFDKLLGWLKVFTSDGGLREVTICFVVGEGECFIVHIVHVMSVY